MNNSKRAWVIVLLVAFAILIFGAGVYFGPAIQNKMMSEKQWSLIERQADEAAVVVVTPEKETSVPDSTVLQKGPTADVISGIGQVLRNHTLLL